jgi:hypothetical protein
MLKEEWSKAEIKIAKELRIYFILIKNYDHSR